MPEPLLKNSPQQEPVSPEGLFQVFQDLGLNYSLHHHVAVFTVEESQRIEMDIPGCHTRNLFLKDKKDRMVLVTLSHDTKIDLNRLSTLLSFGRFSFGSSERLEKYLGVRPGSVTPLSIINDRTHDVTLVLEQKMMASDIVNVHPLVNTMTVGMTPQTLLDFLAGINVTPRICDLSPAAPDIV